MGLSDLPTSISYLDSLTTLDISNNQLLDLPDAICSLDVIDGDEFLFNDNHLCEPSTLPSCIIEIIDYTEQKCDVAYDEDAYGESEKASQGSDRNSPVTCHRPGDCIPRADVSGIR